MKSFEKNKGTWIAVIVFIMVIILYKLFFQADQTIVDQGASAAAVGDDIIAMDQSLSQVTLDLSLLNTPTYRALVDFSPTLTPQPVGRTRPFDPVGK
jgi:hypothetical protein